MSRPSAPKAPESLPPNPAYTAGFDAAQAAQVLLEAGDVPSKEQLLKALKANRNYQGVVSNQLSLIESMLESNAEKARVVWQVITHSNEPANPAIQRASFRAPWFIDDEGSLEAPPLFAHTHELFSRPSRLLRKNHIFPLRLHSSCTLGRPAPPRAGRERSSGAPRAALD
jgi:hypothetical protein